MYKRFPGHPLRLKTIYRRYNPPLYFITFCTHRRKNILANDPVHQGFLNIMRRMSSYGNACGEYVIMPDHIHLFLRIDPVRCQLGRTIGCIRKSLSKPLIAMGYSMPHWQPGFFDHMLRSPESYAEKWDYVRMNPVQAGLVESPEDWVYQGKIMELRY